MALEKRCMETYVAKTLRTKYSTPGWFSYLHVKRGLSSSTSTSAGEGGWGAGGRLGEDAVIPFYPNSLPHFWECRTTISHIVHGIHSIHAAATTCIQALTHTEEDTFSVMSRRLASIQQDLLPLQPRLCCIAPGPLVALVIKEEQVCTEQRFGISDSSARPGDEKMPGCVKVYHQSSERGDSPVVESERHTSVCLPL